MSERPDVVVVGAGAFGAWTAYKLCLTGRSVTLLDAFGAGNTRASSGGESRIIRISYGDKILYSRWSRQSLEQWRSLFSSVRQPLFYKTGVLWLGRDSDSVFDATLNTLTRLGAGIEVLPRNELDIRFPQFDFNTITRSIYEPDSGIILARRAVDVLVKHSVKSGVNYRVAAVSPIGSTAKVDSINLSDGSSLHAETFVFACGPWLPKLFPEQLGVRLQTTRQEVFFFGVNPGDQRFSEPAMPAWIDYRQGVYGIPDVENLGIKIGLDEHGQPFDPDHGNRIPSTNALLTARQLMSAMLPLLRDAPLLGARVCQYTNSCDGHLLIDRHPAYDNVWLVGAGSGHGFKLGPAVGNYVVSLIDGGKITEPDVSFAAKRTDHARAVY